MGGMPNWTGVAIQLRDEGRTLSEIGKVVGVSQQRVSQILIQEATGTAPYGKSNSKYGRSSKRRAAQKRYERTSRGKETWTRYNRSDKGRAAHKKYQDRKRGR